MRLASPSKYPEGCRAVTALNLNPQAARLAATQAAILTHVPPGASPDRAQGCNALYWSTLTGKQAPPPEHAKACFRVNVPTAALQSCDPAGVSQGESCVDLSGAYSRVGREGSAARSEDFVFVFFKKMILQHLLGSKRY